MGFSTQERINLFTKALAAGVIDANSIAVWYETFFPFSFILDSAQVWTQLPLLRQNPAANLTAARANAAGSLAGTVVDLSQNSSAVRLTEVAGTNKSTYVAYSTYDDKTSPILNNWLLPQLVPQANGSPSNGYAIWLYDGDPASGGSLVSTTAGTSGTGINKTVGWIFNYANGLLFLSDDFRANISDPYIVGFRYIGNTAGSAPPNPTEITRVAHEDIAEGDVLATVEGSLEVQRASSDTSRANVIGVALSSALTGNTVPLKISGEIAVNFTTAPITNDNGKRVWMSGTEGGASMTAPSLAGEEVISLGHVSGADGTSTQVTVLFNPRPMVTL